MNKYFSFQSAPQLAFIALAYVYAWALHHIPNVFGSILPLPLWLNVAFFNVVLAIGIVALSRPKKIETVGGIEKKLAWASGPLVLLFTLAVVFLSEGSTATESPYTAFTIIMLCLIIPIAEEIIFRQLIANWISLKVPGIWAIYVSGLVFAIAHTDPPLSPWPPLGPFLLGCVCTWAYRATGRLIAPILLHAACNGSAVLFTLYAPSWLDQLSWLYQKL